MLVGTAHAATSGGVELSGDNSGVTVPTWNDHQILEERVDELEARVAALEGSDDGTDDGGGTDDPPAPSATFDHSPQAPETGETVTFDGTASTCAAAPCAYAWSEVADAAGGDETQELGSGATLEHAFEAAGDRHVELRVTDDLDRTDAHVATVTVDEADEAYDPGALTLPLDWMDEGNTVVEPVDDEGTAEVTVSDDATYTDDSDTARVGLRPAVAVSGGTVTGAVSTSSDAARAELRFYSEDPGESTGGGAIVETVSGALGGERREVVADVPSGATHVALRAFFDGVTTGDVVTVSQPTVSLGTSGDDSTGSDDDGSTDDGSTDDGGGDSEVGTSWQEAWSSDDQSTIDAWFAQNTGPRVSDLEESGSIETTHDGQVIEGRRINGHIEVSHDNVTIRDVEVVNSGDWYSIWTSHSQRENAGNGVTIEHVRIDGRGNTEKRGIALYDDTTVYRTSVIGHTNAAIIRDGFRWIESYSGNREAEVSASDSHGSGLGAHGAEDVEIRRSHLDMGQTGSSALSLYPRVAPIEDVVVSNTMFNGGSYCLYAGYVDKEYKDQNRDIRILDNKFGRKAWGECGQYGPFTAWNGDQPGNEWSGNVWLDNGAAVGPS